MPFDLWLKSLPDGSTRHVQADLVTLNATPHPFLAAEQIHYQIERLSCHLGGEPILIRQAAIAYSLYVRQLDCIQDREPCIRSVCSHHCRRPPVGCCNSEHHVILSPSDILFSSPSRNSLHLAHVLTALQNREHAHAIEQGRLVRPSYCSHLTATGCTLRLFKSPRCIHYLCPQVQAALFARHGNEVALFLAAMHDIGNRTIHTMQDFTSVEVMSTAAALFTTERAADTH